MTRGIVSGHFPEYSEKTVKAKVSNRLWNEWKVEMQAAKSRCKEKEQKGGRKIGF